MISFSFSLQNTKKIKKKEKEKIINFPLNVSFTFVQHSVKFKFHYCTVILLSVFAFVFTIYQLVTLPHFSSNQTKVSEYEIFYNLQSQVQYQNVFGQIDSEHVTPFPAGTIWNLNMFRAEALNDQVEFQTLVNWIKRINLLYYY